MSTQTIIQESIQITNEDNMELMSRYQDNHFDLAIVDPNYSATFNTNACANNKAKKGDYKISNLNVETPDYYFDELFRVSKHQIIWGANWYGRYFGVGGIVWDKQNTGNYSPCEYAYKSLNNHIDIFKFRWNGMLQGNMKDKEKRIHPTQKPRALYQWLLLNYAKEGDKILDTHIGSGSIAIAVDSVNKIEKMNLTLTGCEIDKDYYEKTMSRIKAKTSWQSLF